MKRTLGSLLVVAGLFGIGLTPAHAASTNPYAVLVSKTTITNQLLLLASPETFQDPIFQSFLSSYVNTDDFDFSLLTEHGMYHFDQNTHTSEPTLGTIVANLKLGGIDGVGTIDAQPELGNGGGTLETQTEKETSPLLTQNESTTPDTEKTDASLETSISQPDTIVQNAPEQTENLLLEEINSIISIPKTIQLVELYPNTIGNDKTDEYIKIKNTGEEGVNLAGWTLVDASGKTFTLQEETLDPDTTATFTSAQTSIALNNTTETVNLFAPDQSLVDSVSYTKTIDGDTFIVTESGWNWSSEIESATSTPTSSTLEETSTSPQIVEQTQEVSTSSNTTLHSQNTTSSDANVVEASNVVPPSPKTLQLVELYPNTTGDDKTDEFIVVKNTGNTMINLKGWKLQDASGKKFTFGDIQLTPNFKQKVTSSQTNIALNNGSETVYLYAPDNTLIDSVTYNKTIDGDTYRLMETGWFWSSELTASTVSATVSQTQVPVEPSQTEDQLMETPASANTQTSSQDTTTSEKSTTVLPSPKTLQLVELYPNTTGDDKTDEYIILKNTGNSELNLQNWSLTDASGKTFIFAHQTLLPGETYKLTAPESGLALNNGSESLKLLAPDQELIDSVSYEKTKDGETLVRKEHAWLWSSAIQASQPTISKPAMNTSAVESTSNQLSDPSSINSHTIALLKQQPDGTSFDFTGTVTVAPGVLGKQFFYVQDETGGIQVYKNDATFPDIQLGSVIHLVGELSTSNHERRAKISKDGTIELVGTQQKFEATKKNIHELNTDTIGELVKTQGVLSIVASNHLTLEQNGIELEIALSSYANIDTSEFLPGMQLEVTGIVRPFGETIKLAPRSQSDVVIVEASPVLLTGTVEPGNIIEQKQNQFLGGLIAAVATSTFVLLLLRHVAQKKHQLYVPTTLAITTETVH